MLIVHDLDFKEDGKWMKHDETLPKKKMTSQIIIPNSSVGSSFAIPDSQQLKVERFFQGLQKPFGAAANLE